MDDDAQEYEFTASYEPMPGVIGAGSGGAGRPDLDRVGELFQNFLEQLARPAGEDGGQGRSLTARLREHLGRPPGETPVVKAAYPAYDHPNVHLALERWFTTEGRTYELIGMTGAAHRGHYTLSEILESADRYERFVVGAVDYAHVPVSPDDELACVSFGFYLGTDGDDRLAVLLRGPSEEYGRGVEVEVLAPSRPAAQRLLTGVDALIREHNVFRGQVLSFEGPGFGDDGLGPFRFLRRPRLSREAIVLPPGLLEQVERQVAGVARRRERLRAAGQHLRRGVLLYGPPAINGSCGTSG